MKRLAYLAAVALASPIVACGSNGGGGGSTAQGGSTSRGSGGADIGGGTSQGTGGGMGGSGGAGGGVIGDPTGVTAIEANDFLDSIGVCVHVGQGVDDPTQSAKAMGFAGIRVFRDDGHPEHVPDWIAMHQSAGVRIDVLTNQDVSSTVGMAKQLHAAGALLAVEGPNEPNNFPVTYQGQTSNSTPRSCRSRTSSGTSTRP